MRFMELLFFIAKRMVGLVLILIILTIGVFSLTRSIPGEDVALMYVGSRAKPEQIEIARKELGLDKPLVIQYIRYLGRLIHGDLGISFRSHRHVIDDLRTKLPMTFELIIIAWFVSLSLGLLFGVFAALNEGTWIDKVILVTASVSLSIPIFFLALILQIVFFNLLGWFPLQGRIDSFLELTNPLEMVTGFTLLDALITRNFPVLVDAAWHAVLPVVSLSFGYVGYITRITRTSLLEVMSQNYILSARASGISERVLFFRYGLRNAMSPILTVMGLAIAILMLFTLYTEIIFNYPGMGSYALNGILDQDYPVLLGVVMLTAVIYVISNAAADIVRKIVDPRIK